MFKKYLPIIIPLVWKLITDPAFKQLVFDIAVVEGEWLAGKRTAEDALNEIVALVIEFFNL